MKESVIIQKLIQVGQMLERGQLEYSGAEADTIYLLEQYSALRQPDVSGRSEQLVNFLLHLNDKKLINNHDFDFEKEAKKYLKKIN